MTPLSRRAFLGHSAAAMGALAVGNQLLHAADDKPRKLTSAADLVALGGTGIKTSLLGMGTGSIGVKHSSNQVKLGQEKFTKLIRYGYDQGIRYFDTADQYGSHIFLREALKGLPRDKLFIQTKTRARTADQAKADVDRFREELGVDYIDSLLMHCMTDEDWPTTFKGVMDVLSDAKARKSVRAVGVTCHGLKPLTTAANTEWVEIDQARINPLGGDAGRMDGTPEQVAERLKTMHEAGKGVLGMKILAEGTLKTEEDQIKSLRYVLGLGSVDAFVIGFESPQQIDQVVKRIEIALKD
jgi:aryl-alcohol dehydrogenase-like predicted oxidoreductase